MLKLLVESNDAKLCYDATAVNKLKVFKKGCSLLVGSSGELASSEMLAQSRVFSKKLKSWFTRSQVETALAKLHALKYVRRRFKV